MIIVIDTFFHFSSLCDTGTSEIRRLLARQTTYFLLCVKEEVGVVMVVDDGDVVTEELVGVPTVVIARVTGAENRTLALLSLSEDSFSRRSRSLRSFSCCCRR